MFELNVKVFKIDSTYIIQLQKCLNDLKQLNNEIKIKNGQKEENDSGYDLLQNSIDTKYQLKISKVIEDKINEIIDLINDHESIIIPMEILT